MGHRYYKLTCNAIKTEIAKKFPNAKPDKDALKKDDVASHFLYIVECIENYDPCDGVDSAKAGGYIKWLKSLLWEINIWKDEEFEALVQSDIRAGHNRPIPPPKS